MFLLPKNEMFICTAEGVTYMLTQTKNSYFSLIFNVCRIIQGDAEMAVKMVKMLRWVIFKKWVLGGVRKFGKHHSTLLEGEGETSGILWPASWKYLKLKM